jgi:LysM repeat protein
LSTSLKRLVGILGVGVALSLAILAMVPGMAEAQKAEAQDTTGASTEAEQNTTEEKGTPGASRLALEPSSRVVVEQGDSLWSISEERLGSGAPPQQIADEVERIFELNREQIGENPNVIVAGQELLVPAVPNNPATPEEPTAALEEPTTSELVVPELIVDSDVPSSTPMDEEAVADAPADEDAVSDAPTDEESAPVAASVTDSLLGTYSNFSGRQLLGLGILALTLILAILMLRSLPIRLVWRLPEGQIIGYPTASSVSRGYYGYENHAPPGNAPLEYAPLEDAEEQKGMPDPASEPFKARRELNSSSARLEDAVPLSARGKERLRMGITLRRMRQRKHSPNWRE